MTQPIGRRERKKAQTRKALADAAWRLFAERGYDQVTVADVAEAADVSVTTLFKHFESKEALVFDRESTVEAGLVAAVRERGPGRSILDALRAHLARAPPLDPAVKQDLRRFTEVVSRTPALREYARRMWMRHEDALSRAIAEETGAAADDIAVQALARYALEAVALAEHHPDPQRALSVVFDLLERGWGKYGARPSSPGPG
ncbi:TetR/AcrR family transcriptional regulator [Sorangium sp. So ce385]|uniref:TetR/AcrR family transcriptional regulator n=1 Tax=Sorangium sp. So ce385 TaxID=3133308 RepID=UPI003F5B9A0A